MINLTDDTFDGEIAKGTTLVDFWAEWCGPCRALAPVLDELSKEMPGVKIAKMNVDESSKVPAKFNVQSIPTMILFKDGQKVGQIVGLIPKNKIKEFIEKA